MLLNHALHAVAFRARDQRILQLLRIDSRRVLAEQRHCVIRGDHALHHLLVFQQTHPLRQTLLLCNAFVRGIVGSSSAHKRAGVLRRAKPGISGFAASVFAIQRAHKTPGYVLHARIAVWIAIPVAQHHIMFGTQIIVAAILGKREAIYEQAVAAEARAARLSRLRFSRLRFSSLRFSSLRFSEQRPPGPRQRLFLDLAQRLEQILSCLTQDDLLAHLKGGHALAILDAFALAHAFIILEQDAAALQHLGELLVQLRAEKFGYGQPRQQVD